MTDILTAEIIRFKLGNTSKVLQSDDYKILKLVLKYAELIEQIQEENTKLKAYVKTDNSEVIANLEAENKKLKTVFLSDIKSISVAITECPSHEDLQDYVYTFIKEYSTPPSEERN